MASNQFLTERDKQLLGCYADLLTNQQAAARLGLVPSTVRTYASQLYAKLNLQGRVQATIWALDNPKKWKEP